MKACINPKCFYHVDIATVDEKLDDKIVKVARCTEGFKNRLKFMPSASKPFCPTCAEAVEQYIITLKKADSNQL